MTDPLDILAMRRAVQESAEVEVQLSNKRDCGPLLAVLARARTDAAIAIAKLADVDPEQPKEIRKLPNDVRRFRDLVAWLAKITADGFDADALLAEMDAEDHEELISMIAGDHVRDDSNEGA